MKDITAKDRTADVIATEINYIKRRACETLLRESVEIGKLLCEAKKKVSHGEWGTWLSENVDYSQSTANNLMRLYEEYGEKEQIGFFEENRIEIFGNISPSQALALIALPYDERREYVKEHDMESVSVRDIQEEIRLRKQAEERADGAESREAALTSEIEALKNQIKELESEQDAGVQINLDEVRTEVSESLRAEYEKKLKLAEKSAEDKLKAKSEKLKTESDKLKKELSAKDKEYESRLSAELEKAKKAAREQVEKEFAGRLESMKSENDSLKKKAAVSGNEEIQKFSVHFELYQKEFTQLLSALERLKGGEETETADKLRAGLKRVTEQFCKSL